MRGFVPELTIVDLPSFKADPKRHGVRTDTIIAIDFTKKIILIGNSSYAGEMKKSVFTTLNFYLPAQSVMPMHCSANVGKDDDVALFFGLSGTGKTTLSADPNRILIGDDEHGWSPDGVFNSRAAATPGASSSRPRPSPKSTPRPTASARCSKSHSMPRRGSGFRRRFQDRKHRSAYPLSSCRAPRAPVVAGIRGTSSSSPPTPSA